MDMHVTENPSLLGAAAAAQAIREGRLTSEALTRACLDRIAARDPVVKAWSYIDPDYAIRQAREVDKRPPMGKLHGVPVGIKDMIDTRDMPTQHNSPIYTGHRPGQDAACVETLRAAGAVILGKTDTTEFAAAGRPAATRNPLDPRRTAGGSSSGSAAAVADHQVPLAFGTQTGGSTIRPASFCGVPAMKPSWGSISREGLKVYSVTLDTLGIYGRDIADLDLVCDVFDLHDDAPPRPVTPATARIALCRSPAWDSAGAGLAEAMECAADRLRAAGATVDILDLPDSFAPLGEMQRIVMHAEGRAAFLNLVRAHGHQLHDDFHSRVENRDGYTRAQLLAAYDHAAACRTEFDAFALSYDAVLTPSAPGEAPIGSAPGNAVFNRMWTLLHVPCINLPCTTGPDRMPIGVTLVGGRFMDRQLLRAASSLAPVIAGAAH
jgi:Asp-tRNA(Asn)/Glu-tRNA(Gln) amidotransferase A subunit family amidase